MPWRSPMLKRSGWLQGGFGLFNLAVGMMFYGFARVVDTAVMEPTVYGELVTGVPAEWWAEAIMAAQTLLMLGVIINGAWRWSPILRVLGSFASIGIFGSFTLSAVTAVHGDFFVLCCGAMAVTYMVLFVFNVFDLVVAGYERR